MIKKLHIYIVKEFTAAFLFGLAVFAALLLLDQIFSLVDLFLSKGVALWTVIRLFALIMPNILTLAIPMAVLFGALMAYGRLSEDNEITAMKASCINYKTLSFPVLFFVAGISFFLIFFNHFMAPAMHGDFRNLFEEIVTKRPLVSIGEKTLTKIGDYNIYANKVDSAHNTLAGVSIYKFPSANPNAKTSPSVLSVSNNGSDAWRITASSAVIMVYANGVKLKLFNGYWQKADPSNINKITHLIFSEWTFPIPLQEGIRGQSSSVKELSSPKILKTIKQYKQLNAPFTAYETEYWQRWIFALAPICFAFVAIPVGMMSGKRGKGIGFAISLGVILLYYAFLLLATTLGEKGLVPTSIIIWTPNVLTAGTGLYLYAKVSKK